MSEEARWRERVAAAQRRGDHLATFDAARESLAACPDSLALHYAAILALARSGATRSARAYFDRLGGSGALASIADPALAMDFAALDGRLHKDCWTASEGEVARRHAEAAGRAYAAAFAHFDHYYPAINAATMFLAAGNGEEALRLAGAALARAGAGAADYWSCATAAEAALVLGDPAACRAWLGRAAARAPAGLDAIAATRRQVLRVAALVGADPALVDDLPAAPVRYWLDDDAPGGGAGRRIEPVPAILFGVVATTLDVSRAALLLGRGHEVNLVLPCEVPAWLDALPGAQAKAARIALEAVLREAANVVFVTREGRPDEPAALQLCRDQARGLALLRAESLAVRAERLVWPRGDADPMTACPDEVHSPAAPETPAEGRAARAIVFGDVRGFSRLGEADQLAFLERVVGGFAEVLAAIPAVDYAETAGDGLYVVLSDVENAARCCLALRDVLEPARLAAAGLPAHLGLRLSAHVGPVYRRFDPVIGRHKFCGSEVIRTARIEPVTPVGEIYVTEQFAAVLADRSGPIYSCDYAGRQPMAKGFGECRMYSLRRRKG